MGWHSVSQPAREFLCKITELSMFAADFVLGHFLLFIMLPVILVPKIDMLHSMMLFWLRPGYVSPSLVHNPFPSIANKPLTVAKSARQSTR